MQTPGPTRFAPVVAVLRAALRGALPALLAFGCGGDGAGGELDAAVADAEPPSYVELVGHSALLGRGMNSAIAIAGDHAYIGSRTDGVVHENTGVLIVDISDPGAPEVVGEIGYPEEALLGMSSRELRAVPDLDLLIVLNFACSTDIHACRYSQVSYPQTGGAEETDNLRFYDISDPTSPQLVYRYDFGSSPNNARVSPHEFFLWRDPEDPARMLLYFSTPIGPPALTVLDVSDVQNITTVATFDTHDDGGLEEERNGDTLLHSVGVTADGTTAFLSHQGAGFLLADTSEVAAGTADPQITLRHAVEDRVDYSPPEPAGIHSAVEVPGRDLAVVTDEIYPKPDFAGCPWGWMRIVDYADPSAPIVAGEYKVAENDASFCVGDGGPEGVTYTAHNTTATANLAMITWHSAGLQFVDISDPAAPAHIATFMPEPLGGVAVEDPALGGNPVLMWSYPIVRDGLIYVVDIRNGLYILRYTGPYADEVSGLTFLEGNSNLR